MSSLTITNNFTNSTTADAEEVDANFTDVKDFVDSHCVHKDETALEAKSGSPGLKFQYGDQAIEVSAGNDAFSETVTFAAAFATTPKVIISHDQGTGGSKVVVASADAISTSQFTAHIRSADGSNFSGSATYTITYIAIGT